MEFSIFELLNVKIEQFVHESLGKPSLGAPWPNGVKIYIELPKHAMHEM